MGQRFRTLPLDPTFFVFDLFFDLGPRSTLGWMRSGSVFLPVERFHSSYVWSEILPVTKSSANLRRWALLLNGIPAMLGIRENAGSRGCSASWRPTTIAKTAAAKTTEVSLRDDKTINGTKGARHGS